MGKFPLFLMNPSLRASNSNVMYVIVSNLFYSNVISLYGFFNGLFIGFIEDLLLHFIVDPAEEKSNVELVFKSRPARKCRSGNPRCPKREQ